MLSQPGRIHLCYLYKEADATTTNLSINHHSPQNMLQVNSSLVAVKRVEQSKEGMQSGSVLTYFPMWINMNLRQSVGTISENKQGHIFHSEQQGISCINTVPPTAASLLNWEAICSERRPLSAFDQCLLDKAILLFG